MEELPRKTSGMHVQISKIAPRSAEAAAVFADESSDEEQTESVQQKFDSKYGSLKARDERAVQKVLEEDAGVYDYDAAHDDIERRRAKLQEEIKSLDKDKKSKYVENLLKAKKRRELEQLIRDERKQEKEKEAEDGEFDDKETFVTGAYRKQLEEAVVLRKELEESDKIDELTNIENQKMWRENFNKKLLDDKMKDSLFPDPDAKVKSEPVEKTDLEEPKKKEQEKPKEKKRNIYFSDSDEKEPTPPTVDKVLRPGLNRVRDARRSRSRDRSRSARSSRSPSERRRDRRKSPDRRRSPRRRRDRRDRSRSRDRTRRRNRGGLKERERIEERLRRDRESREREFERRGISRRSRERSARRSRDRSPRRSPIRSRERSRERSPRRSPRRSRDRSRDRRRRRSAERRGGRDHKESSRKEKTKGERNGGSSSKRSRRRSESPVDAAPPPRRGPRTPPEPSPDSDAMSRSPSPDEVRRPSPQKRLGMKEAEAAKLTQRMKKLRQILKRHTTDDDVLAARKRYFERFTNGLIVAPL